MKRTQKELIFLRSYAFATVIGMLALLNFAFTSSSQQRMSTLDVERINIIEKDGTVKMMITNADHFPGAGDTINNRGFHQRKKRAGMLFFNEEGMECGGFIYDGAKTEKGHSSGMSLTFDQYDGDQVLQILATDQRINNERYKKGGLIFTDRPDSESQMEMLRISEELRNIKDRKLKQERYNQYKDQGKIGSAPRVYLGKTGGNSNGLFLYDDNGKPKARFYVDADNNAKLEILGQDGEVISSWPE